ncbi:MAG: hypothetical protein HFH81_04300 [Lachnospiraceae bacterium]|jgi:cell fate regulator YaaT (PSP1 superfamily)|nr:hypothetical protein [Lachnospiraceae bacterium]
MTKVVGIRFRTAGKIYFFDPLQFEIKRGDNVIVETARGIEFGTAVSDAREVTDDKVVQPLKPVLRLANERDRQQEADNKRKEKEAYKICLEKIQKHGLEMKLIDAEYTFDNNKVLFYFTADGRIDFRELVKDLAGVFKTRIELRQIGVRDETKILGGIGICGRPLCCHTHLSDFIPVSIKMAKEQNLSLNPTKISGVCGRLMCCLKHEEDTYEELNRRLPGIGDFVTTEDGLKGQVQSVNVLRQLVKVVVDKEDEKEILEYPVEELRFRRRHSKKEQMELSREELQELERMEQEDQLESREEQPDSRDGKQERSDRFGESGAERRERQDRPVRTGRERAGRDRRQEHGQRQQESGERQRYSREGNQDRSERYSREGGQDRSERYSREGSQDRSERYSREGSQDRSERYSREGGQSRRGRYERGEGNTRRDRGSDRRECQENRPERQGRGERQERGENRRRGDSHSHRQGTPGNRPRRERSDHEWEQNE